MIVAIVSPSAVPIVAAWLQNRLHIPIRLAGYAGGSVLRLKRRLRKSIYAGRRHRLRNRSRVVVVPRRLRQQEDVLVRLGASVAHAFGHGVRLGPNDVLPKIPAVSLQ